MANLCLPLVGKVNPCIPLPVERPNITHDVPSQVLDLPPTPGTEPSVPPGMPLESILKPVDAFSGVGSYPTSGEGVKRTSELLIEFKQQFPFRVEFWEKKWTDFINGWDTVPHSLFDVVTLIVASGVVYLVGYGLLALGLRMMKLWK